MNEVKISLYPITGDKAIFALDEKIRRWADRRKFGISWRCRGRTVEVDFHDGPKDQVEKSTKSLERIVARAKAAFAKDMPLHPALKKMLDSAMAKIPSPASVTTTERLQRALASIERARQFWFKAEWALLRVELENSNKHIAETINSL